MLEGLGRVKGWEKVGVVAAETYGAASFSGAWTASSPPSYDFMLDSIDTIASTLGARQVARASLERAYAHTGEVRSVTCSDAEAVDACIQFADDHKILVEPSCGASLALVYSPRLRPALVKASHVVFEVCGGR